MRLYQSIYETALRNQIPRPVIDELIRIYSYDVDFQRKAQPGDTFEVLYAGEDEAPAAKQERRAVRLAHRRRRGQEILPLPDPRRRHRRLLRRDRQEREEVPGAQAGRRPASCAPASASRHHPILGYTKMHTGVDWAAPLGTPIYASGNGTVEKVGWEGGYGKYVRIKHANGYETAYGHMTAFAARHRAGRARAPGPGDRLCRLDRPLDRRRTCTTRSWSTAASSIRCASGCRAAACSRPDAGGLRAASATASTA